MWLELNKIKMSPQQEKIITENEIKQNESISNSHLGTPNEKSALKGYWKTHISIPSKFKFII